MTDEEWRVRVAVLEAEHKHVLSALEFIKASQLQMTASVRRMEDKFVAVSAWKMAILAFLPIAGGLVGAKFQAIMAWLGGNGPN
jgi:uncharacterized protein YybS (DUF2232 family)